MTAPEFSRVLVAVDDSAAALAAARVAVGLAGRTGARLRFVTVLGDGDLVRGLAHDCHDTGALDERRDATARALLRHVGAQAGGAGINAEGVTGRGEPARVLL
ncbi:MAG: universal stress protein, partial [Nocardioidaceae bacterium]